MDPGAFWSIGETGEGRCKRTQLVRGQRGQRGWQQALCRKVGESLAEQRGQIMEPCLDAPWRSLRFQVASSPVHVAPTALQQSVLLAAQPLLNKCPEEEHSTICFLVFGSTPCLQKAACVWFPCPQSHHRAFSWPTVKCGSSPAPQYHGIVKIITPATTLGHLWRSDTGAIPSPSLEGLLAHPAINVQMAHFLLQRKDFFFFFLRSAVFECSQMTSRNQSEI